VLPNTEGSGCPCCEVEGTASLEEIRSSWKGEKAEEMKGFGAASKRAANTPWIEVGARDSGKTSLDRKGAGWWTVGAIKEDGEAFSVHSEIGNWTPFSAKDGCSSDDSYEERWITKRLIAQKFVKQIMLII
jgi:hypothetical protein